MTTERPILFSAPMVRAILAGTKTQTRRIVKLPDRHHWAIAPDYPGQILIDGRGDYHGGEFPIDELRCPYGKPGDRLWVRETWQGPLFWEDQRTEYERNRRLFEKSECCVYAADGGPVPEFIDDDDILQQRWRPSIHMPRWASRITLEVTRVRVEQLQDISVADSIAEGVVETNRNLIGLEPCMGWRYAYEDLWNSINGARSWNANPWVWVVEFVRQQP